MEFYSTSHCCVKCGCTDQASSRYRVAISKEEGDYIERMCQRCGYIWQEKPLDREHEDPFPRSDP